MRRLNGITDSVVMNLSKLLELVMDWAAWRAELRGSQRMAHDWVTELNWLCRGAKLAILKCLLGELKTVKAPKSQEIFFFTSPLSA